MCSLPNEDPEMAFCGPEALRDSYRTELYSEYLEYFLTQHESLDYWNFLSNSSLSRCSRALSSAAANPFTCHFTANQISRYTCFLYNTGQHICSYLKMVIFYNVLLKCLHIVTMEMYSWFWEFGPLKKVGPSTIPHFSTWDSIFLNSLVLRWGRHNSTGPEIFTTSVSMHLFQYIRSTVLVHKSTRIGELTAPF